VTVAERVSRTTVNALDAELARAFLEISAPKTPVRTACAGIRRCGR
jgi:hypothetical protein